ncbi:hypothetical protein RSO01_88240 [Reyranella soli]|uniref:Uncharacterized protein n=2 Tax=Reyranella soli TaxID=1230389 RepID=A0A512NRS3_9HYPH|nr:hypothetical protein RSO01_88240 [Reyranella soli]
MFQTKGPEVEFRNGAFSVFPFNRYSTVDSGKIVVTAEAIHYELSTKLLVILLSFSGPLLGFLVALKEAHSIIAWIGIPAATWACLIGINYMIIKYRNYLFIQRLIHRTPTQMR